MSLAHADRWRNLYDEKHEKSPSSEDFRNEFGSDADKREDSQLEYDKKGRITTSGLHEIHVPGCSCASRGPAVPGTSVPVGLQSPDTLLSDHFRRGPAPLCYLSHQDPTYTLWLAQSDWLEPIFVQLGRHTCYYRVISVPSVPTGGLSEVGSLGAAMWASNHLGDDLVRTRSTDTRDGWELRKLSFVRTARKGTTWSHGPTGFFFFFTLVANPRSAQILSRKKRVVNPAEGEAGGDGGAWDVGLVHRPAETQSR
ncbi:hypothetical protein H6P81_005062 [Aristolochia fimbriata]|uniref:Uncharacterized protein n=1 Tax=Aristolochia fimbriata TaxID=158543 RepID=A0AAV7ETX1_ARIFI|nr:hypothetical protein H6P81_005062 [Aristolochia fimbriata]